jgi:hypothetical protein
MSNGTSSFQRFTRLLLTGLIALAGLNAQETRGTIQGRILDPRGSAIPGAAIQITNEGTNVATRTQSDSQGDFAVPFLPPGFYRLAISAQGFKNYTRSGAELRIDDRLQLDVKLEVGDASQQITVTAAVPVLDTASANLGQVIDSRSAAELPTLDGSPFSLVYLSPGIIYTYPGGQPDVPQNQENAITQSNFYGTPRGSTEFTIDGVPNTQNSFADYGTGVLDSPPGDIVQEFKLETPFDASAGHTTGTIVNFALKGGTNVLHGTAYAIDREPSMVANNWFSNRAGVPQGHFLYHRWGATATGPVVIPKLYQGRNRTFFTFGYEGSKTLGAITPYIQTMPTAAEHNGDFSYLLKLGSQYQIYDPATIHPYTSAGRFTSNPFPGNIIPVSRFDPVGAALLSHYPMPNLTTGGADGTNNWGSFSPGISGPRSYYNYIARVDHNISEKQRLTARIAANLRKDGPYRVYWNDPASGLSWNGPAKQAALDYLLVLSPTLIFDIRYGLNRYQGGHVTDAFGYNATNLGYSPAVAAQLDSTGAYFPTIHVTAVGVTLAGESPNVYDSVNQSILLSFSKTAGVHNLKFGADIRGYQNNVFANVYASGNFTFDTTYTRGPLDNSTSSPSGLGQGVAALLLGIPTSGYINRNANEALTSQYEALYFHDNWRATGKLTLDLGLRWEHEPPETERYNRAVNGFDPTATLSITSQALANYTAHPDASLLPSQLHVLGGLEFAGVNGQPRGFWDSSWKVFAPRFGAAYSVGSKLVVRAGFGVFPMQKGLTVTAGNGAQGTQNWAIQSGYSQQTSFIPTQNNGQTFTATIDNPFPNGILPPAGNSQGVNTLVGSAISLYNPAPRTPYEMFATINAQYRLPGNVLLEVGVVSNKAIKLEVNHNIDGTPNRYLSAAYRDNTTINYDSANITNPFLNLLPGTTLNGSTIARHQLLQPYPQFTTVTMMDYQGASWYNGLQIRVHKRLSSGVTVIGSYGFSKLIEALTYLNAGDPVPARYISPLDRPQNLSFAGIFELPVGHGRWLFSRLNRIADGFIGGWQVGTIWHLTSGAPLSFGNIIINGDIHNVALPGDQQTVTRWINTSDFNTSSSAQPSYNLRTLSPYFSSIRAGYVNNWDMNLMKNIPVHERLTLQFRLEALNVFNHPSGWAPPDTTPTDLTFGQVTSLYAASRQVQMQLKLRF